MCSTLTFLLKVFACLCCCCLTPMVSTADQAPQAARVGLVAEDSVLAQLSGLLMVELSGQPQLQLVERDRIRAIYREQALAARNADFLKVGQLLGADGLLVLDLGGQGTNRTLSTRVIAVRAGVVISAWRGSWPVVGEADWAKWVANHLKPFFPKLLVLPKEAVPVLVWDTTKCREVCKIRISNGGGSLIAYDEAKDRFLLADISVYGSTHLRALIVTRTPGAQLASQIALAKPSP